MGCGMGERGQSTETDATLSDLIERLEGARDSLAGLAQRPTNTRFQRDRLAAKREGVVLALSYAREAERMSLPPAQQPEADR